MVIAFSNAPSDATSDQLAQAQVYIDGGNAVIADATQKHLDAGFTEEQVTKVKTDLVADNIFVSVLIGQDCLIGQVVVADRSFVTEAAPAVGPDKSLCLIGTTRPIDW